jgi:hypothetical protein
MSQFPTISSVSNLHPDTTDGSKPPSTDSDGDKIPDVHENLFEEWMNWTAIDGRPIFIQGMDSNNASDALIDIDNDGLNSTEEYCWPYPANCTAPGFPRGLTGIVDEEGERSYLDPRVSDTDGDGMPDGYELEVTMYSLSSTNAKPSIRSTPRTFMKIQMKMDLMSIGMEYSLQLNDFHPLKNTYRVHL